MSRWCERPRPAPAPPEAAADAPIELGDPAEDTGFLICDAGTAAFRVLYADQRARGVFAGRCVIGAPLDAVFDLADDGHLARRLRRVVSAGGSATFFTRTRTRCRDGVARDVHAHLQPLAAADDRSPWALCTFDVESAAWAPPEPRPEDEPAGEIGAIVERLAERLGCLLPGRVDVQVCRGDGPQWVAASADDVEEIVSSCLAVAKPLDPWHYTVKLAVQGGPAVGRVRLAFALVGDRDDAMAQAPLPDGVGAQLAALGLELERDGSLEGCRGLALVMPRWDDGLEVAREEVSG